MSSPLIVIAGASGYIGKAIIPALLDKFPQAKITALSRGRHDSSDPRVEWRSCDLFSLKSLEESMPEHIDLALYLVHSMGPTAQLDQGSFADYDLILADNFGRAIKKGGVKQLVYLGGLIPETDHLSLHLQSRLEVEETFRQFELPATYLRAGLIIGEAGSSFQILLKLTKRLPVMLCPKWTQTLTTPVSLGIVIETIVNLALESQHLGKIYDLAGCKPLTYIEMMRETAVAMKKKRFFISVPFFTPTLSRLWVSLITNTPKALVYPLVESLKHSMLPRENHLFTKDWEQKSYSDLLKNTSLNVLPGNSLFRFRPQEKTVRSVQRLPLPSERDAVWVKEEYARWLPRFLRPFIKVTLADELILFSVISKKLVLLELKLSADRSHKDRQLLYIVGGRFTAGKSRARLEFRVVLNRRFILAAIHDFNPALPWFIYKYSQAVVHIFVMRAFGRHLRRIAGKGVV